MITRLIRSRTVGRPLLQLRSWPHLRTPLSTLTSSQSHNVSENGEPTNEQSSSSSFSRTRQRALFLFLLTSTSLSIAAYHLSPSRRLQLDAESDTERRKRRFSAAAKYLDDIWKLTAESYLPSKKAGFSRFDFAQVGSNEPIEDYHSELFVPSAPDGQFWSFFTILDGHAGFQTAEWLSEQLLPSVSRSLIAAASKSSASPNATDDSASEKSSTSSDSTASSSDIQDAEDRTIADTFLLLDDQIVNQAAELAISTSEHSLAKASSILERAYAGSCAIMAFCSTTSDGERTLKVANTGDCRAILGRKTTSSSGEEIYEVHLMSNDHNGHYPAEVARLNALHPDEDLWSKDGHARFIGWGPSRAFGDGRTKWTAEVQGKLEEKCLGRSVDKVIKTPPYFTAEPEIITKKVKEGDFLVMATDGLWECLNNEEVVGLVGAWISHSQSQSQSSEELSLETSALPVKFIERPKAEEPYTRYAQWRKPKRFVFNSEDGGSVAQHLMRNALGGADEDLRRALLELRNPRSRRFRDDISITVVMF